MNNNGRWRIGILASAIAVLGSLASLDAHALALGRITVQSALGEPLRAEIDIADINAEEATSLKAGVASAETFKAAGFDYSSVVADLEVNLQRRADGRAYLRLTSRRPVTEPFVDLIVQANWSSGRITRDYTMLFDPPTLRSSSAGIAATPVAPTPTRPAAPDAAPPARAIAPPTPYAPPRSPKAQPSPVAKASPAAKEPADDKQVTVKAGDTAGKIAAQNKSASVSLDQMLVALLTSNPDAFIGGNVNRIKAGAVLDIPGTEAASAISPGEASQMIVAQSKDFNAFRRKLAEGAPIVKVASAERQADGKVQAQVEDRTPASVAPDKLTLSKGAVQGTPATVAEDIIAKDRQAKDAAARVAELSKNISDLNKLEASPAPAPSAAAVPGVPLPAPATAPAENSATTGSTDTAAAAPASADLSAAAPLVSASEPASAPNAAVAPAVVAARKPVVTAPPPPPEPSLIDELLENPLVLPLVGGLLALLAGFGFYRYRQRNSAAPVDSSFLESRLQPDSFFGASGGQRIDTNDGNVTGSSLVYSPSQLDAAGDVDPVAEADVYLAYGRDLQAEEILKEALLTHPTRVAIHAKLLEIYVKRHDNKAFEAVALDALKLTHGNGPEWAYITEMGRELDPANPMYKAGKLTATPSLAGGATALDSSGAVAQAASPEQAPAPMPVVDVDLDLDFSLSDTPDMAGTPSAITAQRPTAPEPAPEPPMAMDWEPMDMDFGAAAATPPTASSPAPSAKPAATSAPRVDFPSDGLAFAPAAPKPVLTTQTAAASALAPADNDMLEFDLNSLSLDLSPPPTESPTDTLSNDLPDTRSGLATESPSHTLAGMSDDPLETRLLLAEEFHSMGDTDGARSLAEEVLAKSSGPLKVKAQAFLSALS